MRKNILLCIAVLFALLGGCFLVHALLKPSPPPEERVIGLWGGKWDDFWPVFILVQPGAQTNSYAVRYVWQENSSDPAFSTRELIGQKTGNHLKASFLIFKATGDTGLVYGNFSEPRMANLVRMVSTNVPAVPDADKELRKSGWTENAIPAAEALQKITTE